MRALLLVACVRGAELMGADPQCPDTIEGEYTCEKQQEMGKCGEDWMIGNCCSTCFACAKGCGADPQPSPPACAEVEPEGSPGSAAAGLFQQLVGYWKEGSALSGQTLDYYDQIAQDMVKSPLIKAFDMQNFSPHNPWGEGGYDDGNVDSAIEWYKSTGGRGIVQFQWHWFAPMGQPNSDTKQTFMIGEVTPDFDTAKSVESDSEENKALLRDLKIIAEQLTKLKDAGVPVLWRALHEARGDVGNYDDGKPWFWWGSAGPVVCLQIFDLMRDMFLGPPYNLDNLIWVWSDSNRKAATANSLEWYPGNDKIDIVGIDSYPASHDYSCDEEAWKYYQAMTECKKPLALTEVGSIPDMDTCHDKGVHWLYFMAWGCGQTDLSGGPCDAGNAKINQDNEEDHIRKVYESVHVKSLEDLPSEVAI